MNELNMKSIMKKVEEKAMDRSFLSKRLEGKEYKIKCHACGESVVIRVTKELTGICPLCGHVNELTFSIK